jgi:hypothetical protein
MREGRARESSYSLADGWIPGCPRIQPPGATPDAQYPASHGVTRASQARTHCADLSAHAFLHASAPEAGHASVHVDVAAAHFSEHSFHVGHLASHPCAFHLLASAVSHPVVGGAHVEEVHWSSLSRHACLHDPVDFAQARRHASSLQRDAQALHVVTHCLSQGWQLAAQPSRHFCSRRRHGS